MFSDRDALLAAIRANPEEDTPRLMFADWLDENGEADRAEFIRVQCELARLADDGSDSHAVYEFLRDRDWVTRPAADWTQIDDGIHRRVALTMRVEDLLKRHRDVWAPKLPKKYRVEWPDFADGDTKWIGFHRGFPHRVTFGDVQKIGPVAERLRIAVPPVTLVANDFTPAFVEHLAAAGLLGWIAGLELDRECAAGLRELGHRPEARGVRTLTVRYDGTGEVASALAESPNWTGLRALDLVQSMTDASAAEALFLSKNLRSLRRLHLRGLGDWTADTIRAFATGEFNELNSLHFVHSGLTDEAVEGLAGNRALAQIRSLDLGHNQLGGRGVTDLLCSPHLTNLAFLGLEANPLAGLDAPKLAALAPGALRMLHAHGARFRTADVRALARCPRLRTLWYLDLDSNNLSTAAVRAMVRGFGKWCPPILWLTYNRIDDRGAELLANWKAASALRVLHLRYNHGMTDAGVCALLDSPNLTELNSFGVSGATDETAARILARFKHFDDYQ